MNTIRIILWVLALILAFVVIFLPKTSAKAEAPVIQDIKTYSIERVIEEFGGGQWTYFDEIIYRESRWKSDAQNPTSSAYGLCQFLSATYKQYGGKTNDPYKQIDMCIEYIKDRYGTPKKALYFHQKNNYY